MQSEINSYSTAIENHDFMLWPTLPRSTLAFLMVLHLPVACTGIEESWVCMDWIWRPAAVRILWQACRKPHWVNIWPQSFCSEYKLGNNLGDPQGVSRNPPKTAHALCLPTALVCVWGEGGGGYVGLKYGQPI